MAVAYYIFMFVLGFVLLICGSSLFVDSAVSLANKLHLPEVLIGATIVSIGTTLPESFLQWLLYMAYRTWHWEMHWVRYSVIRDLLPDLC